MMGSFEHSYRSVICARLETARSHLEALRRNDVTQLTRLTSVWLGVVCLTSNVMDLCPMRPLEM